jgi:hypothetical protein
MKWCTSLNIFFSLINTEIIVTSISFKSVKNTRSSLHLIPGKWDHVIRPDLKFCNLIQIINNYEV